MITHQLSMAPAFNNDAHNIFVSIISLHSVLGPEKLNESNCIIVRSIQGVYDGRGQRSCKSNYVHFIKRPVPHAHTACVRPGPHAHTVV